jgi:hypothetical protein
MTNQNQALQTIAEQHSIVPADVSAAALQSALAGDLSKLTGEDRLKFYGKLCEFTGLNPLSKPFDWIQFQGKLTLYPNKGCAEQLRVLHGVTFDDKFDRHVEFGVMTMTVRGENKAGRRDFATAALPFDEKMPAEAKANQIMKLETKAKRRFTLSICGLTMFAREAEDQEPESEPTQMPETSGDRAALLNSAIEVETIPGATPSQGGETQPTVAPSDRPAVGLKPAASEQSEVASDKQRAGVSSTPPVTAPTATGENLPKAVAGTPTGPAEQPRQASQASATSAGQAATAVPDGFTTPDGLLADDVVGKIEAVLAQGDPRVAIRWLVFKGQLRADENNRFDLARLNATCANWILRKPKALWTAVNDWVKQGGDKQP